MHSISYSNPLCAVIITADLEKIDSSQATAKPNPTTTGPRGHRVFDGTFTYINYYEKHLLRI